MKFLSESVSDKPSEDELFLGFPRSVVCVNGKGSSVQCLKSW